MTVGDVAAERSSVDRSREATVADLRARIARMSGGTGALPASPSVARAAGGVEVREVSPGGSTPTGSVGVVPGGVVQGGAGQGDDAAPGARRTAPVPAWLGGHLAAGGLPRGAVTVAADCPPVLVDLLTAVTAAGGCAGVVGYPRLALAAVEAAGGDVGRIVVVPDPAPHAEAVVATLVEGLDLLIYAPAGRRVPPTAARPVEARLRRSRCAFVVCGGDDVWPHARLRMAVRSTGVVGLGRGSGRIRGVEVEVSVHGRDQPPHTFTGVAGRDVLRVADEGARVARVGAAGVGGGVRADRAGVGAAAARTGTDGAVAQ
ncbi:hypothetical protein [Corynebacterium bovis]|uniref:hypothetical protein n=3 Tax=Corynebacterium bovis TaxID=36808 RepID=UPI000F62D49A|nr:hypothetical protein [Corynebacterium bovis]